MVEILGSENIQIPEFQFPDADTFSRFTRVYDKQRDILYVSQTPKVPAVAFDVGGHFSLRYAPETGAIVGFEIEDFERVFLVKYPELSVGWDHLKPSIIKRKPDGTATKDYLRVLMIFVRDILQAHPQQLALPQR